MELRTSIHGEELADNRRVKHRQLDRLIDRYIDI